jgi:hypothetical protein
LGGEAVAAGLAKACVSEEFGDDGAGAEPSHGPQVDDLPQIRTVSESRGYWLIQGL